MQEVQLDNDVKLVDCPGVVMLKSGQNDVAVVLCNCKRIEKLEDPTGPVKEILRLCPAKVLVMIYKVPSFDTVEDFLQKIATIRGKLKKGGSLDVDTAARIVLHDWNEGKIPFYTMPPARNQGEVPESEEAKIVSALGKEFNIDEVYGTESSFIRSLKSVDDFSSVEVSPNCPMSFDEQMLEDSTPNLESNDMNDNNEDEPMEAKEEADKSKVESAARKLNEKLYDAEGMLNTKLKRAENKRRKNATKVAASGDAMDDDADYDFKVDYKKGNSDMQDEEGDNDE